MLLLPLCGAKHSSASCTEHTLTLRCGALSACLHAGAPRSSASAPPPPWTFLVWAWRTGERACLLVMAYVWPYATQYCTAVHGAVSGAISCLFVDVPYGS
jgi:hypothetical protein